MRFLGKISEIFDGSNELSYLEANFQAYKSLVEQLTGFCDSFAEPNSLKENNSFEALNDNLLTLLNDAKDAITPNLKKLKESGAEKFPYKAYNYKYKLLQIRQANRLVAELDKYKGILYWGKDIDILGAALDIHASLKEANSELKFYKAHANNIISPRVKIDRSILKAAKKPKREASYTGNVVTFLTMAGMEKEADDLAQRQVVAYDDLDTLASEAFIKIINDTIHLEGQEMQAKYRMCKSFTSSNRVEWQKALSSYHRSLGRQKKIEGIVKGMDNRSHVQSVLGLEAQP